MPWNFRSDAVSQPLTDDQINDLLAGVKAFNRVPFHQPTVEERKAEADTMRDLKAWLRKLSPNDRAIVAGQALGNHESHARHCSDRWRRGRRPGSELRLRADPLQAQRLLGDFQPQGCQREHASPPRCKCQRLRPASRRVACRRSPTSCARRKPAAVYAAGAETRADLCLRTAAAICRLHGQVCITNDRTTIFGYQGRLQTVPFVWMPEA